MNSAKCLIVMPLGPDFPLEFAQDTIDSFNRYMPARDCVIWLMDDTGEITGLRSSAIPMRYVTASEVFPYSSPAGIWNAPLGLKLLRTMAMARADFDYDVVLRIDTDAVVTGPSPHLDAARQFEVDPEVAIIGAFRKRGDGSDKTEAMRDAGTQLRREMGMERMLVDLVKRRTPPSRSLQLRRLWRAAKRADGYALGDTCTGGAVFISRAAVDLFVELGFDDLTALRFSQCSEDWIFGLFTAAAGMRLSDDLSGSMCVNWRGLPCPPEEVVERGVKVFHPVKLEELDAQAYVRQVFADLRAG